MLVGRDLSLLTSLLGILEKENIFLENASPADVTAAIQSILDALNTRDSQILIEVAESRTIALTDKTAILRATSTSATVLTIPPQATVAFTDGFTFKATRDGSGSLTIAAGAGVTIESAIALELGARYSVVSVYRVSSNVWRMFG